MEFRFIKQQMQNLHICLNSWRLGIRKKRKWIFKRVKWKRSKFLKKTQKMVIYSITSKMKKEKLQHLGLRLKTITIKQFLARKIIPFNSNIIHQDPSYFLTRACLKTLLIPYLKSSKIKMSYVTKNLRIWSKTMIRLLKTCFKMWQMRS